MPGHFVVSLDFELMWGVRDHFDRKVYSQRILGARRAIPRILDLFADFDISATWAVVGFLLCRNRDELEQMSPPPHLRPNYTNHRLSNYNYFDEVGPDERRDPLYYGGTLVQKIIDRPGQEIATHSFSHFYTLEPGSTLEAFQADIESAKKIAHKWGLNTKSIVFPRNQYGDEHVNLCQSLGITRWRGVADHWAYQSGGANKQTLARRGLRLFDAYSGVLDPLSYNPQVQEAGNIAASRFLRPRSGVFSGLHDLHINVIKRGMARAAIAGHAYHLWWHPHNFGLNMTEGLVALEEILSHFSDLSEKYGMLSVNMRSAP